VAPARISVIAKLPARWDVFGMKTGCVMRLACGLLMAVAGPMSGQQQADGRARAKIPDDLLDDPHVREELAVNEFTAPMISKLFEQLEALAPLPLAAAAHPMPARMPLDRADLAIELGFLIADGFLVVQNGELGKVESLAKDLSRYGKALGAGERVNRHAAALLEAADKGRVDQLKTELTATQKDVERDLVDLQDADLAHLISLGGWIRALEAASIAVAKDFTPNRAKRLMREDIADYYEYSVGSLEPRISERPAYIEIRDLLTELRSKMIVGPEEQTTPEQVAAVRKASAALVKLALARSGDAG
jgi:hypothetical protein